MGQLRDRMEADLTLAGYSPSTRKIYLLYARLFVHRAFDVHPRVSPRVPPPRECTSDRGHYVTWRAVLALATDGAVRAGQGSPAAAGGAVQWVDFSRWRTARGRRARSRRGGCVVARGSRVAGA